MKIQKEQTLWMQSDHVYVVSGGSSAQSLFMEDKLCHEIFFNYFNRFVGPMVDLLHYKVTSTSWAMLIKVRNEEKIQEVYLKQRSKSPTADRNKDLKEASHMLSEHFRMFLSNFAKRCNYYLGREGVWVKKRFDKILVSNENEYKKQFELICDLQECNYRQLKEKYQASECKYDQEKLLINRDGFPHELKSGNIKYFGRGLERKLPCEVLVARPFSLVLREILKNANRTTNPPKNSAKLE